MVRCLSFGLLSNVRYLPLHSDGLTSSPSSVYTPPRVVECVILTTIVYSLGFSLLSSVLFLPTRFPPSCYLHSLSSSSLPASTLSAVRFSYPLFLQCPQFVNPHFSPPANGIVRSLPPVVSLFSASFLSSVRLEGDRSSLGPR